MGQDQDAVLPISGFDRDLFEMESMPPRQDAQFLHNLLDTAFQSFNAEDNTDGNVPAADIQDAERAQQSLSAFSQAAMRQARAFQALTEQVCGAGPDNNFAALREGMRDVCEALIITTAQAKLAASEADGKFEALTDMVEITKDDIAAGHTEAEGTRQTIAALSDELKHLRGAHEAGRTETAALHALIQSTQNALKNDLAALKDSVASLHEKLASAVQRVALVEERTASYPEIEGSVASLHEKLGGTIQRVGRIEDRTASYPEIEDSVASLHEKLESAAQRVVLVEDRTASYPEMEDGIASLHKKLESAAQRVSRVEGRTASYSEIEDGVAILKHRIADLEQAEEAIAALTDCETRTANRVDAVAKDVETVAAQVGGLNKNSERIANSLRAAEQAAAALLRREKNMAALHARAALILQPPSDSDIGSF